VALWRRRTTRGFEKNLEVGSLELEWRALFWKGVWCNTKEQGIV
jgi:hypothetical protein